MKYALATATKEKSDAGKYATFLRNLQSSTTFHKCQLTPGSDALLVQLENDSDVLGKWLYLASETGIAHKVLYFADDPVVFESSSSK